MKTNGNDKALESYKIFPFIAWGLVAGFAIFVYMITLELQSVADRLEQQSLELRTIANTPPSEITDFDIRSNQ